MVRSQADRWSEDDTERTLTEVSLHKGDVSVVNFGANPATSAQLNSAADALEVLATLDPEAAMAELRSILSQRAPLYSEAAQTIDTSEVRPNKAVRLIAAALPKNRL